MPAVQGAVPSASPLPICTPDNRGEGASGREGAGAGTLRDTGAGAGAGWSAGWGTRGCGGAGAGGMPKCSGNGAGAALSQTKAKEEWRLWWGN